MFGNDDNSGSWAGDDDDDEGVFEDTDTVFGEQPETSANPVVTREADTRLHSPPAQVRGAVEQQPPGPVALVAHFDNSSQPWVARTIMQNGKPVRLEEFRRPTPDEYNSIMFGGKIIKGGVVGTNVSTSQHLPGTMQKTPLGGVPWSGTKKLVVGTVVTVVAIGAGYGIWRWKKGGK